MKAAFLPDRGVVKVSGEDARNFLNGLVTTDATLLRPGLGRFGALLTPQGKITADFLITEAPAGHGGGFLIDCPRALAPGLSPPSSVSTSCAPRWRWKTCRTASACWRPGTASPP